MDAPESDSEQEQIKKGALLEIANHILELMEYSSELENEDDLFLDEFYIAIVGNLVSDREFDISPGQTEEEKIKSLNNLIEFLSQIIDMDFSHISAQGIIHDHDRVSAKCLLELLEELIKALKEQQMEADQEQEPSQTQDSKNSNDMQNTSKGSNHENRKMNLSAEEKIMHNNSDIQITDDIKIDNANDDSSKKYENNSSIKNKSNNKNSSNSTNKKKYDDNQNDLMDISDVKEDKSPPNIDTDLKEEKEKNNRSVDINDDNFDIPNIIDNYSSSVKPKADEVNKSDSKNKNKSNDKKDKNNINNNSSNRKNNKNDNIDNLANSQNEEDPLKESEDYYINRSCFEPLDYEKYMKNEGHELSYDRKTMTQNDISRYERQCAELEAAGEEDEINYLGEDDEDKLPGNELEESQNLPETPIKNVSHISEVSKSKENSEQHKFINQKIKSDQQSSKNNQSKKQDKSKENNNNYEDISNSINKENDNKNKNKNNISNTSSQKKDDKLKQSGSYISGNKDSDNADYSKHKENEMVDDIHQIDYDDMDYDIGERSAISAHSLPQARQKMKLTETTHSLNSYKNSNQIENQGEEDEEEEEELAAEEPDNNIQYDEEHSTNPKNQNNSGKCSQTSNKKSMEEKNKRHNNNVKDNNMNNNNNISNSDISKSSVRSNKSNKSNKNNKSIQNNNNNSTNKNLNHNQSKTSMQNKESTSSILEEIPFNQEEFKFEIIKEFRKIYGDKLDRIMLKNIAQNSNSILELVIRNIKLAKQKTSTMRNRINDPDDLKTKEFMHRYEKELQYIIKYYNAEKKKRDYFKERQLNSISQNFKVMKKIQEIKAKKLESEIERRNKAREVKKQHDQIRMCNEIYSMALQMEKERYLEETAKEAEIRRIENEEKRKKFLEMEKYYNDKIAILKEILKREKNERDIQHRAKLQFFSQLQREKQGEFKKQIDDIFDRFDEEDRKVQYEDNNQEEIEKILNNYYKK